MEYTYNIYNKGIKLNSLPLSKKSLDSLKSMKNPLVKISDKESVPLDKCKIVRCIHI